MLVEPTRSQNITVTWRRSADSAGGGAGLAIGGTTGGGAAGFAMAFRSRLLCPSRTPSFSRSASLRSGKTSASTPLSRNAVSYCPSPRLRSHSPTSMVTFPDGLAMIVQAERRVHRENYPEAAHPFPPRGGRWPEGPDDGGSSGARWLRTSDTRRNPLARISPVVYLEGERSSTEPSRSARSPSSVIASQ